MADVLTEREDYPEFTDAELKRIYRRRWLFEQMGIPEGQAFDLAIAGVPLIKIERLLEKGCPTHLVADILT